MKSAREDKQFVHKVAQFSSQYGSDTSRSYSACNLGGKDNSFPSYGDFTQAFVLRTYGPWWKLAPSSPKPFKRISRQFISEDFVEIVYERPVYPTKIEIVETYNPGAVVKILALQLKAVQGSLEPIPDGWVTLWSGDPQTNCPPKARRFSPPLRRIKFPINTLRLEFNQRHLLYYTELDAVVLHGTPVSKRDHISQVSNKDAPGDSSTGQAEALTVRLLRQLSLSDSSSDYPTQGESNGYFDVLPSELILLIFTYLHLTDLIRAAATCRLFFRHCHDPLWYRELDLMPHWMKVNDKMLEDLQSRCCATEKMNLSWSGAHGVVTSGVICRFFKICGMNLVCLRLRSCSFVTKHVLSEIALCCPQLEELDIASCLELGNDKTVVGTDVQLHKLKHLKTLNLYRIAVDDDALKKVARFCPGLQHLNIGGCLQITSCDDVVKTLTEHCGRLVSLDLWRCNSVTSEGVKLLANGCPLLEELDLGWCSNVNSVGGCLVNLTTKCTKLKKLFLTAIRSVSDADISSVADSCPQLEQLDILGTALVYPKSVQEVLTKCRKLKFLDLSFCSQLDRPFVLRTSKEYPDVSIKRSFITVDNVSL